jgi:UDP-N-acetylglucosamine 2-epimerase (non-hydrolysing)
MKILVVFGTRPEAIKCFPVVEELKSRAGVEAVTCTTAQHRKILDQVLELVGLTPDIDLHLMRERPSLTDITTDVLHRIGEVIDEVRPDRLLVQGDTTTAFASALAAFYEQIPVGHVEAGLRTDNLLDPFPEEANRRLISQVAQLHFAPTGVSEANLKASGVVGEILVTGNTVIDALLLMAATAPLPQFPGLDWERQRVILATVHRRENWGERLTSIGDGFRQLLDRHPDTALLLPLHRNPTVREPLQELLGDHPRAVLCEPLDYDRLVGAIRGCTLLLSDSGGLQEEAPALGKPVLVLRRTTERPEAVSAGTARLIGTDSEAIVTEASLLLDDPVAYAAMAQAHNPFGDGQASGRILEASRAFLG